MIRSKIRLAGLFLALASVVAPLQESLATTWIVNAPFGALAPVRSFAAGNGPVLFALPTGTTLALTGRCTGGLNLADIADRSPWRQRWAVGHRWCETVALGGSRGWIYGGFMWPD